MKTKNILSWILRLTAAVILLQTLFFKFTGHPQSVELFSMLGVEPWGRVGTGIMELIASTLLLLPKTKVLGALTGIGLMAGAILSHVFVLGIESYGDGGLLFGLAITVLVCCLSVLTLHKRDVQKWKALILARG